MSLWYQHILEALESEKRTTTLPFQSLFEGLFLPEHRICLHFISADPKRLANLPATYFMNQSDQAQAQECKLIHLWEDVYTKNANLVRFRILALLGKRTRIHGRATLVKRIDKPTAALFLQTNHLQFYANAYYKFGLYHMDELVAVATFSKSRVMQDEVIPYRSYELIRFASKAGVTVSGGLGKLLKAFINEVHPAHIMTYADRDWGTGEGYEKLGFSVIGKNQPLPFYLNPATLERVSANQIIRSGHLGQQANQLLVYNAGSLKYTLLLTDYIS
jgi:hypothetical protein